MNISRTLTATLAAAFTLPALADIPASRVPAPVKEQVQKQYPNAGAIEWDFDSAVGIQFHLVFQSIEVEFGFIDIFVIVEIPFNGACVRILLLYLLFPGVCPPPRQADYRPGSPEVPGGLPVRIPRRAQSGALLFAGRQAPLPKNG